MSGEQYESVRRCQRQSSLLDHPSLCRSGADHARRAVLQGAIIVTVCGLRREIGLRSLNFVISFNSRAPTTAYLRQQQRTYVC